MGIRMDQFAGLPDAATAFLHEHEIPTECCPTCKRPFPREIEVIGKYYGMFEDKYPLHRHALNDGRTADEFLQAAPWSSGPIHFIGLKVSDGTEFVWTEEEIDRY